jgi:hypothetical protein
MPLSKKIDENERLLSVERERNGYIADCENLRKQAMAFCPLVMEKSDTNEWISYLLDGLRKFQVKLRGINSKQQRNVGPYLAAVLSMEIEGSYSELKNYIEWLESSESLVRIDTLQLEKVSNNLLMRIMVLGIVSKK